MNPTPKIQNLWGDLPLEDSVRTPSVVLREQASLLTEATNGLLIGNVTRRSTPDSSNLISTLEIIVPSLNNYSISIAEIKYPITTMYPLTVISHVKDYSEECQTEEEIERVLGGILSSQSVKTIISGLLSQVCW